MAVTEFFRGRQPQLQDDRALLNRAEKLLRELVDVDSSATNFAGVNRVQRIVARELEGLGFISKFVRECTSRTPNDLLIAELAGESPEYITFFGKADTSLDLATGGGFRHSDVFPNRALGAGILNGKGGLVVLIQGLRIFLEGRQRPHRSLRVVSSPNDDLVSLGFFDSEVALGFTPALENGAILESPSGNGESAAIRDFHLETLSRVEPREGRAEKKNFTGPMRWMSRPGVAALDGLGPVGGAKGTADEFVFLPSLASRALALAILLDGPGSYF